MDEGGGGADPANGEKTGSGDILGAPVAELQGEIGASTVRGRNIKIKITLAQFMF